MSALPFVLSEISLFLSGEFWDTSYFHLLGIQKFLVPLLRLCLTKSPQIWYKGVLLPCSQVDICFERFWAVFGILIYVRKEKKQVLYKPLVGRFNHQ